MTVIIDQVDTSMGNRLTRFWLRFGMIMSVGQADMLGAVLANPLDEGKAFRQVMGL